MHLILDVEFVHLVEEFITSNQKAQYKYMSPFSNISLVCVHISSFTNLIGGQISKLPTHVI